MGTLRRAGVAVLMLLSLARSLAAQHRARDVVEWSLASSRPTTAEVLDVQTRLRPRVRECFNSTWLGRLSPRAQEHWALMVNIDERGRVFWTNYSRYQDPGSRCLDQAARHVVQFHGAYSTPIAIGFPRPGTAW